MIKMVSQFEDEKMRASVTTPTCGPCCSCCCSCIVTTLVSSVITARNFGRIAEKQAQEKSFSKREVGVAKEKIFASLLGFFALPLSLSVLFFFILERVAVVDVVIDWLYWIFIEPLMLGHEYTFFLMLALLHMASMLIVRLKYKISLIHALLIVFLTIVFIRLEIEVWSYFISFNQNRVNNF